MPEYKHILYEVDGDGVATLTFNEPERLNAFSWPMMEEFRACLKYFERDTSAHVIILKGAGRCFSPGYDFKETPPDVIKPGYGPADGMEEPRGVPDYGRGIWNSRAHVQDHIDYEKLIWDLWKPVIAQVQGIATAAGCQLVSMCDLAVAAHSARFAVSGVNLGLFCATPSVALSRNLSRKAAFEMLVTGNFISADEALAKGLVNAVCPPEELEDTVTRYVDSILHKPRVALAMGKQLFYRQLEQGIEAAYESAGQTMA